MKELKATVVLALAGLLIYASAVAEAQEYPANDQVLPQSIACEPACQIGSVCNQGVCVSLCNPPCGSGEICNAAGHCLARAASSGITTQNLGWFKYGYGHIGGLMSFWGKGKMSFDSGGTDVDLTQKFSGGLHLSGYYVLSDMIHLGVYFNYIKGKIEIDVSGQGSYESDMSQIGVGGSIKVGGKINDRIWLGVVGDLGYYNISIDDLNDSYNGFEISPRFHMDVLAFDVGGFKMGAFASLGPSFVPYIKGTISQAGDFKAWLITIQLRLGLTFGG